MNVEYFIDNFVEFSTFVQHHQRENAICFTTVETKAEFDALDPLLLHHDSVCIFCRDETFVGKNCFYVNANARFRLKFICLYWILCMNHIAIIIDAHLRFKELRVLDEVQSVMLTSPRDIVTKGWFERFDQLDLIMFRPTSINTFIAAELLNYIFEHAHYTEKDLITHIAHYHHVRPTFLPRHLMIC